MCVALADVFAQLRCSFGLGSSPDWVDFPMPDILILIKTKATLVNKLLKFLGVVRETRQLPTHSLQYIPLKFLIILLNGT